MSYSSTIIKKKKRCTSCGTLAYIFSKGRCEPCARVANARANQDRHFSQGDDGESFANLRDDLDQVHSLMVRLLGSDEKGIAGCYTCGSRSPWRQMQCGHFVHREDLATRWYTPNTRVQCKHCNEFLDGNTEVYEQKLEAEEKGLPDRLREMAREICKPSREELKALIAETRIKVKMLEKLKKVS
jgi:hypothetical protein